MLIKPSVVNLEQAAQWYAALRDENVTDAERMAWKTWLEQSPEHQAAWRHIENISHKFEPLRGYGPQGAAAAVASVKTTRSTVVSQHQALNALVGAIGLGGLTWTGWRHMPLPELVMAWHADQHTGTGERRELTLADGSRVWLNTRTALNVDYQAGQRRLVLLGGEILIQTATDSLQRPFYVETVFGRLQALGTRFTVRHTDERTRLDVFEHNVEIYAGTNNTLRVKAGQAIEFNAATVSAPESADRMREAWSQGRLVVDNMFLGALLDELSRYRHGHISVAPEVAGLKVIGVYPVNDPDQVLAMLEQSLPIRVRRSLPWWITVEGR